MAKSASDRANPDTTFSLRDVAVVVTATFGAAVAFFAYDTRISVLESDRAELVDLTKAYDQHNQEHATFRAEIDQIKQYQRSDQEEMKELQQELATLKEKEAQVEREVAALKNRR